MTDRKVSLQLVFDENLKRDTNLPATERLAFDDLGDFIEERERIKRLLEKRNESSLKVDYSQFENHVFFDSAVSKFDIASSRILNLYPFNGNSEEKDAFFLTSSGYEQFIFDSWPRFVGYAEFNGTNQYVSASDAQSKLYLGTSSFYVSAWIKPVISNENIILQFHSRSGASATGYDLYLSGATDPHVKFDLLSGSQKISVSASYSAFTSSFNNVAAIYDKNSSVLSLFVNEDVVDTSTANLGPIEFGSRKFYVASGSRHIATSSSFSFYSGSIGEVRVFHTSSQLYHQKNFSRPVDSEPHLKLRYSFNEGVTGFTNIDSIVIDYSKSGLHGAYQNYNSSTSRVSGAIMLKDPGDPILYSFHSDVVAFTGSMQLSGTLYDLENNNHIFNLISEGVLFEDDAMDGLLSSFSLAMARFFDNIKLYIDQFVNLRVTNYEGFDETPDVFLPFLKRYFGWKVSEHFNDANPLEFLFGENVLASGSLEVPLADIRNQFWRRILNNYPLLMKSKGTRSSVGYLFNVLGLNKENVLLKEYGFLPGTSIQDERIMKEVPVAMLGIGTGSLSSSYVRIDSFRPTGLGTNFTVESMVQLPFPSSSWNNVELTGNVWQFISQSSIPLSASSLDFYWVRSSLTSETGKFVLSSSAGASFSSSVGTYFNGDILHVAAGLSTGQLPYIKVRGIENSELTVSQDFTGAAAFFVSSSDYDFIVGATSGTVFSFKPAEFFVGEVRYWNRALSGSELDDHALNFRSVGILNPLESTHPLLLHWPLDENEDANSSGVVFPIEDLSRRGSVGTGSLFEASANPYEKFLKQYNYLSPTIDLKWTENKIRIRNKTELTLADQAFDTNEVSLEFNLIDALNEDITKIFSTLDQLNSLMGQPIFKYRDEYSDLEGVRRVYFERLGDSLNFSRFFSLFKWFDRKISDSIKQLLPARVNFIGGEQVVESHLLERPRYKYQYPLFRTPQDPPEAEISTIASCSSHYQQSLNASSPFMGTYARNSSQRDTILAFDKNPISRNLFNIAFTGSSISFLTASITANGITETPIFRYNLKDATASELSASGYGQALTLTGAAPSPVLNNGSPLLGSDDDSVLFRGARAYGASTSSFADIANQDMAFEIVFKHSGSATTLLVGKKNAGNQEGWAMAELAGPPGTCALALQDSAGTQVVVVSDNLVDGAWYHALAFVNRDEASTNGSRLYMNSVPATGVDFSTVTSITASATIFEVGSGGSSVLPTSTNIAYCSLWIRDNWFAEGAAGPAEWDVIAKERFYKMTGVYPQLASNPMPISASRSSPAYLEKIESGSIRKLYHVGNNWMRLTSRPDATGSAYIGFEREPAYENLVYWSSDFTSSFYGSGSLTVSGSATGSVTGEREAAILVESAANADHILSSSDMTLDSLGSFNISLWAKPINRTKVLVTLLSGTDDYKGTFDLTSTGSAIFSGTSGGANIQSWGNGWYRLSMAGTNVDASVKLSPIRISPMSGSSSICYTGLSQNAIAVHGLQYNNDGRFLGSLVKTTGSARTRPSDTLVFSSSLNLAPNSGKMYFSSMFHSASNANLFADSYSFFEAGDIVVRKGTTTVLSTSIGSSALILTASDPYGQNNMPLSYSVEWNPSGPAHGLDTSSISASFSSSVLHSSSFNAAGDGTLTIGDSMSIGASSFSGLIRNISIFDNATHENSSVGVVSRPSSVNVDAQVMPRFVSKYSDGESIADRNSAGSLFMNVTQPITLFPGTGTSIFYSIKVDQNGTIWAAGIGGAGPSGSVYKSHITASTTWTAAHHDVATGSVIPSFLSLAVDSSNVYACGVDGSGKWTVQSASLTNPFVWGRIDTTASFNDPSTDHVSSSATAMAFRPNGNLLVAGYTVTSSLGGTDWIVRERDENGVFNTIDRHSADIPTGGSNLAAAIAVDSNGIVYVGGRSYIAPGTGWAIRRSGSSGWSTVDFLTGSDFENQVTGITVGANNLIVACGGQRTFRVRRSVDGHTWQTVDSYVSGSAFAFSNNAYAITFVGQKLYAVGNVSSSLATVRNSLDTETFSQIVISGNAAAATIYRSVAGNLTGSTPGGLDLYITGIRSAAGGIVQKMNISFTSVPGIKKVKVSGDTEYEVNNPDAGVNFKNDFVKRIIQRKERDNE